MKLTVQYFQTEEQDALEIKLATIVTLLSHASDEHIHISFKNNVEVQCYCSCYHTGNK